MTSVNGFDVFKQLVAFFERCSQLLTYSTCFITCFDDYVTDKLF